MDKINRNSLDTSTLSSLAKADSSAQLGATQTFTGLTAVSRGSATTQLEYMRFIPTDWAVGKPYLVVQKTTTANLWNIGLYDSVDNAGSINLSATNVMANSIPVVTTTAAQSLSNKTFTTSALFTLNTAVTAADYVVFRPTDYGVGKPGLFISKHTVANYWNFNLFDTVNSAGTINFNSTTLSHNGAQVLTTATGQPLDSTLTALAAFNSNGSLHQTAADTFVARTLTGTTNQVLITNGNGVSGNPTISLDPTIAAIGPLTITNGSFLRGTGADAFAVQPIVGAVSQSGGVPTGGIVFSGSNANGQYTQYADGTMICTFTDTTGLDTNVAQGSIFGSTTAGTWTYPVAFTAGPYSVQCFPDTTNRWATVGSIGLTTANFFHKNHVASATLSPSRLFAIGRWF